MADTKITALTAISTNPANPATFPIPMVDLLDTSMAASGTTKKVTVNQILGAGGTATLASAAITGAATVGTTLGVTGVSTLTGAVGVGVSPITNSNLSIKSSAALPYNVALQNRNATQNWYIYVDAAAVDDKLLTINDGTSNRVVLDISGNVGIGKTPVASSGCLQLISGVNFPATQVASADANTLDDYEEGNWTIGLTFGGASTGMITSSNSGSYTKVGRKVTVTGYLGLTAKGVSTGLALITGLPFTIGSAANNYSAVSLYIVSVTFADYPMGYGTVNTTNIALQEVTNAGVRTNITDADFANNSEIIFSLTYNV